MAGPGLKLAQLGTVSRLAITSWVNVATTLKTSGLAGIVFDYYAANDYKFAVVDVTTQRLLIGHVEPTRGWVVNAAVSSVLVSGAATTLDVILKGTSVSLTVGGSTVSFSFNAGIAGGRVGLLARSPATFTSIRVRTDDAAFLPAKAFLMAASAGPGSIPPLSTAAVGAAYSAAVAYWTAQGVDPARFAGVLVVVGSLDGPALAVTTDWTVTLDGDAAGWGWALGAVTGRMDLVTVVAHELGHLLGLEHGDGVMEPVLTPGTSWVGVGDAGRRPAYQPSPARVELAAAITGYATPAPVLAAWWSPTAGVPAELTWAGRHAGWEALVAELWGSGLTRLPR